MTLDRYVTLDGYVVRRVTETALGLYDTREKSLPIVEQGRGLVWVPRALCESGYHLDIGDTDVVIEEWLAIDRMLRY